MEGENYKWVYTKRPTSEVTNENYTLVKQPIPTPGDNEVLIRSLYISVDPYMRIQQSVYDSWGAPHPLNEVQRGGVVGEVVKSNFAGLKPGDIVNASYGWQKYGVCKGNEVRQIDPNLAPISTAIGLLGMPGRTAFFGLEVGKPKPGETVVVSGAAGAVGSIVVQLAKMKGCRVVAIAGTEEKLKHLKHKLGADEVINYKNFQTLEQMKKALSDACPNGIDIYFDNVGGVITDAVILLINLRARIIICGQISQYNGKIDEPEMGPRFLHHILYKRATIQGILAGDFMSQMNEMVQTMGQWLKEGKIKADETIVEGFENLPSALNSLFHGSNLGKLIVKV